jgi:hypothetical protein
MTANIKKARSLNLGFAGERLRAAGSMPMKLVYLKYDLEVQLQRETSWANIRTTPGNAEKNWTPRAQRDAGPF